MAISQDEVGRCNFIDVLEEAAVVKRPVAVQLRSGETFIDEVADVVTEKGEDYVVFKSQPRTKVGDIRSCTRAEAKKLFIDVDDLPAP